MKNHWTPGRRSLLGALALILTLLAVAGPAKTAGAATCPKGSCTSNTDCGVAHCQAYTGIPVAGVCSFRCCFCPE
jgi:hypothetical protein